MVSSVDPAWYDRIPYEELVQELFEQSLHDAIGIHLAMRYIPQQPQEGVPRAAAAGASKPMTTACTASAFSLAISAVGSGR